MIQALLTSPDPNTSLHQIALELGEILAADACLIIAGTSIADRIQTGLWLADNSLKFKLDSAPKLLSHPIINNLAEEPIAISDVTTTVTESNVPLMAPILPMRALLKITTRLQGVANGTIAIGKINPHNWTSSEKQLLKTHANSIANAIAIAKLQQQANISNRYQTLLKDIGQAILHSSHIDSILNLALTSIAQTLHVDRGLILMLKYKEPLLKKPLNYSLVQATAKVVAEWSEPGNDSQSLLHYSFSLKDSPLTTSALKNAPSPLAIAQLSQNSNLKNLNHIDIPPSSLFVPLMGSTTSQSNPAVVLGFFVLQHYNSRCWPTDELELVNWVAIQTSTAIIQDRALRRVQSLVDERTAQLRWSLDVQAKLSAKMRQQIQELLLANKLKDQFLATVSDNLKSPLTGMKMAINMLKNAIHSNQRQRYLEILESQCDQEINLVNDLLTFQKLESNQLPSHPEKLNLQEIIGELAESFEQKWKYRGLTLLVNYNPADSSAQSPDLSFNLYSDRGTLKRILQELLTNAGKFSSPDSSVTVDITEKVNPEEVFIIITVINIGQGISKEEQEYIFDRFRRVKGDTDGTAQGIGLGLALVNSLVEHINGTIQVSSNPSDHTTNFVTSFTLTLPQYQS